MQSSLMRRPSPAITVAALALVVALAGTAIAGPGTLTKPVTKPVVKKIASKQIKKLAPGLSVATAGDADALGGQPPSAYASSANPPSREVGAPGEPLFESGCGNYPGAWQHSRLLQGFDRHCSSQGVAPLPRVGHPNRLHASTRLPALSASGDATIRQRSESRILSGGEVQVNCGGGACAHGLDGFTFRGQ